MIFISLIMFFFIFSMKMVQKCFSAITQNISRLVYKEACLFIQDRLRGTVAVILMGPSCRDDKARYKTVPLNLKTLFWSKNVDIVVFLTEKLFISDWKIIYYISMYTVYLGSILYPCIQYYLGSILYPCIQYYLGSIIYPCIQYYLGSIPYPCIQYYLGSTLNPCIQYYLVYYIYPCIQYYLVYYTCPCIQYI